MPAASAAPVAAAAAIEEAPVEVTIYILFLGERKLKRWR